MTKSEKESLEYELISTQNLLHHFTDDPLMAFSLKGKINSLKEELLKFIERPVNAKAVLYFYGDPVYGSQGIEISFLSASLSPFQKMVAARVTSKWHGVVKNKGQIKNATDSKLFLTATPRGSFGVELSNINSTQLFQDQILSESLLDVAKLFESTKNDEDFSKKLDKVQQRELTALRQFLRVLNNNNAGIRLETGNFRSNFNKQEVKGAYELVSSTTTVKKELSIRGILRGILLESWQYDFINDSGELFHGPLHQDITTEEAEDISREFVTKEVVVIFEKLQITLKSSAPKETYILKSLSYI